MFADNGVRRLLITAQGTCSRAVRRGNCPLCLWSMGKSPHRRFSPRSPGCGMRVC